jgi:hypothetical protein
MENPEIDCSFVFAHVLAKFQFLEEGIRIYLKAAYALTRKRMQGAIPISLSVDTLQNRSLSVLLREFAKWNSNTQLIDNIGKLIPKRNHLAHLAFYKMYLHIEEGKEITTDRQEAVMVGKEAAECIELLHKEIEAIEGLCKNEGIMVLE